MKRSVKQTVDVLSGLIAERQKYEQWIAALEGKKASTPPKVYERVHADYLTRLEGVMAELTARSGELESQRNLLKARSDELAAQEALQREERAEADLRNDVGEYAPDEWKELVRTSDAAIAKIVAERAQIDGELHGLERLLAGTAPSSATPARSAQAVASAPPAAATSAPPPASAGATSSSGTAESVHRKSFDELAFLQSVAPPDAAPKDAPRRKPASQPDLGVVNAPVPPRAGQTPMVSMQSVGSPEAKATPTASNSAAPAAPPKANPTPPASAPATPAAAKPADAPPSSNKVEPPADLTVKHDSSVQRPAAPQRSSRQINTSDIGAVGIENLTESVPGRNETPTFLKNVPSEQTKTLKCGECGAMNYATEWYCERCGAELSAL